MKLAVVGGCGYVGLVTSVGFAQLGHEVAAVDIDGAKVAALQSGHSPIYEVGLEPALNECLAAGRLHFSTDIHEAVKGAEVVFVAVGSPSLHDGGTDLSQVQEVARLLAEVLDQYTVIAIKSTVPAGTVQMVQQILSQHGAEGLHADVVVNPEFLREGQGLKDFFFPSRIVIGTDSDHARATMRNLYWPFTAAAPPAGIEMAQGVPYVETTAVAAQMIKYASNAFLATRLSFINEVAGICEQVGADVADVIQGLGYDKRIGWDYLQPGIGFGGPCLEKDIRALIHFSGQQGYQPSFMRAVIDRNDFQVQHMVARAGGLLDSHLAGRRIAVLGLAFKPGTNDVRTSLALRILQQLADLGVEIVAHDPVAIEEARLLMPHVQYCEDPYDAADGADLLMLLTDWPEYRDLDFDRLGARMRQRKIMDGRNLLDGNDIVAHGFDYRGVGKPTLVPVP
jgi:UDPglucose 6-dehydrogenase